MKYTINILGLFLFFFIQCCSIGFNIGTQKLSADDSWKHFYALAWNGSGTESAKYAKQMGHDYISTVIWRGPSQYNSNSVYAGLKFYIADPHTTAIQHRFGYSTTININTTYTQPQIDWYEQNMAWTSTDSFPDNLAVGWWSDNGTTFSVRWDFQQQRVIDLVVEGIIDMVHEYENTSLPFTFAGYMYDGPGGLTGDYNYWDGSKNVRVGLSYWTGSDSSLIHDDITHEYSTQAEGKAAFYKQLQERTKEEFPDAKWIVFPWVLYNSYSSPSSYGIYDEWIYQIKDRSDRDELTPDMLIQEGMSSSHETDFVDNTNNFNSGVNITKNRVGHQNNKKAGEYENRLIAAKAGINGAWNCWFGKFGGGGAMPSFDSSIINVYPRLKLVRCIPNWDNLNSVPVGGSSRTWDGSVYESYKGGKLQSYISSDVMFSRHPKTGKLFAVFNTHNGVITLNTGESVANTRRVDGYFIEAGDGSADIQITGSEIRLKSSVTIETDSSNGQVKGKGYIFTISSPSDVIAPYGYITINNYASYTKTTNVTLTLSATDSVGVTGYYLSTSSTKPSASASGWTSVSSTTSYSGSVSYTLSSGNGSKKVYVWYKDAAGNVSHSASDSIILDTTAPSVTITSPTSNTTYSTTSSTVNLGGSASDGTSGINSVTWSNNRGGSGTATGTASWSVSGITLSDGSNVITVTAKDRANNTATDTITVTYSTGGAPSVTTGTATSITTTSATLKGTINPNGLSTTAWFDYGTTTGSYSKQSTTQTVNGTASASVSRSIIGLSSGTVYYYRAAAQNSAGTSYGTQRSFTTSALSLGVQSHYKFDEGSGATASDSSGNGNNGTISGAGWTSGQSGGGLHFDGTDDAVDFSTNLGITGELTVGAWVYPTEAPGGVGRVIASTYDWDSDSASVRGWTLGLNYGSDDKMQFRVYDGSGNTAFADSNNFFADNLNKWTHVTGVFKPSQYVRLYVNGVMVAETSANIPGSIAYAGGTNLRIGMRADNSSQGMWKGSVDEVRIYNYSLSGQEILDLYDSYMATGNLRAHYTLDEGSGATASDSSGNGNDGSITGAAWANGRSGSGLSFDGTDDAVDFSTNLGITGELTVGAWVYPTEAPGGVGRVIASTYDWDSNSALQRGWTLGLNYGSNDQMQFKVYDSSGNSVFASSNNFFANNLNKWTYVTGVFKPSQYVRLYVNGAVVAETTSNIPGSIAYAGGTNLRIGMRADNANQGMWKGSVDEVKIYNYSLSEQEVQDLYSSAIQTGNLRAHYTLDEGSGATASDSSGNGNDGTINGAAWASGKIGNGLSFDGTDDAVDFSTNLGITGELTVGAWVYPTEAPGGVGRVIASTYDWDSNSALQRGWTLGLNYGSNDQMQFRVYDSSGNSVFASSNNFFANNLNKWTYVTGVFKPSQYVRLYVNGAMVAENATNIPGSIAYAGGTNLRIGMRADNANQGMWKGSIDEVRIYKYSLGEQEVQSLYSEGGGTLGM